MALVAENADDHASLPLDNNNETLSSQTSTETPSERKKSKKNLRRLEESEYRFKCEWGDCEQELDGIGLMNKHILQHRIDYLRELFKGKSSLEGEHEFVCQWRDCAANIVGTTDEFARHVFYHNFHQHLKFLGKHVQKVDGLPECTLDVESRNIIPELPEKLICQWEECRQEFDNPYIFYAHVGFHCQDFPKGKRKPETITCKWEGCTHSVKTHFKIKEHMRSHTQAKQVACPTCGSLFANNTKFVDHLVRQKSDSGDNRFVCSHCNKQFGSDRILRDHMRHHVNFYKCQLCDMTCPSPSHLRDHVRYRHSDVRLFQCDLCDHKSKSASDLKKHVGIHYKTRSIQKQHKNAKGNLSVANTKKKRRVNNCAMNTRSKAAEDLRKHRKTHGEESEEKFPCEENGCGLSFRSDLHLMRHLKEAHGKELGVYACHVCKKRFKRGNTLTNHLITHHNYKWPSGHKRFRYKKNEDNLWRLQTIRFESMEVSQQVLGAKLGSPHPTNQENVPSECLESEEEADCERIQIIAENDETQITTINIIRKSPMKYIKRKNTSDHSDGSTDKKSRKCRKNVSKPVEQVDRPPSPKHSMPIIYSDEDNQIHLPMNSKQSIQTDNQNTVNSPSRVTRQSPPGLKISVATSDIPVKPEKSEVDQMPDELPHSLEVQTHLVPLDLSPNKKMLHNTDEEFEEEDSSDEIHTNNENTDLYNLEMLGAVALKRTRQSQKQSQTKKKTMKS